MFRDDSNRRMSSSLVLDPPTVTILPRSQWFRLNHSQMNNPPQGTNFTQGQQQHPE